MVYKKYIKRDGKIYGPYKYHSRKVNGKVTTEYLGKHNKKNKKKSSIFLAFGLVFFLTLIFVLDNNFDYPGSNIISSSLSSIKTITGFAISEESVCEEIEVCENVTVVENCTNETILSCEKNCLTNAIKTCENVTVENVEEVCEITEEIICEGINCSENIVESCEETTKEVCSIKLVCEAITENITDGYQFHGVNDYIDAGNDANLNFGTEDFTVEAWFKLSSYPTNKSYGYPIVQKANIDWNSGWWLWVLNMTTYSPPYEHSTRLRFAIFGEKVNQINCAGTTALELNTWYHAIGVKGANYSEMYLNGILESSHTLPSVNSDSTENLLIGTWIDYGSYFNGTIDKVRIFNRSLSADEIIALYEQGLTNQENQTVFDLKVSQEVKK